MSSASLHSIPPEPGKFGAVVLALIVHLALVAFLWVGVRWQNEVPVAAEAEIWDIQTREAAPKPEAQPEPSLAKEPPPEPVAETKTVVSAPQPVPKAEPHAAMAKPDIALEREKKRKAETQKKIEDANLAREAEAKRIKEIKLAKEADAKRLKEAKQAKDADAKRLKDAQSAKDAKGKRAQELADKKARAALHGEEMRRLFGNTGSGGSGTAAKSTGNNRADVGYVQKVSAKIKSNTAFNVPQSLNGNPAVEYSVELLPDGSLRTSPRKLKTSGVPGFDEAVLRAIEKSAPYPADRSGNVPPSFIVSHKPKG